MKDDKKSVKLYELRYVGDYGHSVYSRHVEYEEALIAKRVAYDLAVKNGNKRLAASLEIV